MKKVLRWFLCGAGLAATAACSSLSAWQSGVHTPAGMSSPDKAKNSVEAAKRQGPGRNSAAVSTISLPKQTGAAEGGSVVQSRLIGLDGGQLRDLLGDPSEERERTPGKLWRYRYAKNCTLDVLLYPDVQTQTFRSLNYEVTGDDGSDKGKRRCAAQLQSWAGRK